MKTITIKGAASVERIEHPENITLELVATGHDDMTASDGYHTFDELYAHRVELFIALCRMKNAYYKQVVEVNDAQDPDIWRSKLHNDGTSFDGWFILGIGTKPCEQITYHLPMAAWDRTDFAKTLDRAPEFDGHTPEDVLKRLAALVC